MEVEKALLCYTGITVLFFLIFLKIGIYPMSSIILSLIVGQIFLNILSPPYSLNPIQNPGSSSALYILIQIATPIIAIIYIFIFAFDDRKRRDCNKFSESYGSQVVNSLNIKL